MHNRNECAALTDLTGIATALEEIPEVRVSTGFLTGGNTRIPLVEASLPGVAVDVDIYLDNGSAFYVSSDSGERAPVPECSPELQAKFVAERLCSIASNEGNERPAPGIFERFAEHRLPENGNREVALIWRELSARDRLRGVPVSTCASRRSHASVWIQGGPVELEMGMKRGFPQYRIRGSGHKGQLPVASVEFQADFLEEKLTHAARRG